LFNWPTSVPASAQTLDAAAFPKFQFRASPHDGRVHAFMECQLN